MEAQPGHRMNIMRDPPFRVLKRIVTHFYSSVNSILFLLGIGDAYTRAFRSRNGVSEGSDAAIAPRLLRRPVDQFGRIGNVFV